MIWLYAVLSGGVCWLAFQLYDRRHKPPDGEASLGSFLGMPLGKLPLSRQKAAQVLPKQNAAREKTAEGQGGCIGAGQLFQL